MCVPRSAAGVGVLDGILYAVGGYDGKNTHRSAEAYQPSTGVWTTIPDMHCCRYYPGNYSKLSYEKYFVKLF